jgi:ribosomal protein L37AE/L43A
MAHFKGGKFHETVRPKKGRKKFDETLTGANTEERFMYTSKYGASIRKMVDKAVLAKKTRYECPRCNKLKLGRKSMGIWKCKGCDAKFAGAAYAFRSEAGEIAARIIGEYTRSE